MPTVPYLRSRRLPQTKPNHAVGYRHQHWECQDCKAIEREVDLAATTLKLLDSTREHTFMQEPLVSVIIPALNASKTIARAVRSAMEQTYRHQEIIVIDDGSSDDLSRALEPFGCAVQLVRQPNQGAGSARNTGVKLASGELLAFLDADDHWHPDKLRRQVDALLGNPTMTLCGTGFRRLPAGDISATPQEIEIAEPILIRDFTRFFANPYIGTPGVVMWRELFLELGGFRTDITAAEDIDLWLRAAYRGGVVFIPSLLFTVTLSNTSLTARHQDGTHRDNLKVIDDFCAAHRGFADKNARVVRRLRAEILANWGADAYIRGELTTARRILMKSVLSTVTTRGVWMFAKTTARSLMGQANLQTKS